MNRVLSDLNRDIDDTAAPDGAPYGRLAAWHLAWAIVVLIGFLGVNAAGGLSAGLVIAVAAALAPGLMVMVMKPFDGYQARLWLLVLWAVCGAVAATVTGGLGGPMAVWCLAPLAVSMVAFRSAAALAGGLCVLSILGVIFAQLTHHAPESPGGLAGFALGLTALAAMAVGMVQAFLTRPGRGPVQTSAEGQPDLAAMPARLLVVEQGEVIVSAIGRLALAGGRPGQPVSSLARAEDHPAFAEALAAVRQGRLSTLDFVSAGETPRPMTLDLAPGADGRIIGLVRDASQARAREEQLELARADAESLAAGRARFLAGMSHELRTPLNAIMGFSDIMRARMFGELSPKYTEYAELIHESGAHLLDLINDVLDMSKIEAHRYELNKEFMDVREPVSAALRILRVQADAAGVKLRASLPPAPLEVEADRRALKQIVINLVSNALKFTPRDGSVIVALGGRGKDLELTVADTGIGIAPDDLQRIGRPYEQAGDATRKSKGTGLGLSLVRAFAELHGGQMVIESRLGEGTAVIVTLPVVVEDAAAPSAPGNVVAFKPQR